MTADQLARMSDEEKRVALAEFMDWTECKAFGLSDMLIGTHVAKDGVISRDIIPDYLNDLNAIAEVEKKLSDEQIECYYDALVNVTGATDEQGQVDHMKLISATARQRADAILMIL